MRNLYSLHPRPSAAYHSFSQETRKMRPLAVVSLASACCALAAEHEKIDDTTDDFEAGSDLFSFVTVS